MKHSFEGEIVGKLANFSLIVDDVHGSFKVKRGEKKVLRWKDKEKVEVVSHKKQQKTFKN